MVHTHIANRLFYQRVLVVLWALLCIASAKSYAAPGNWGFYPPGVGGPWGGSVRQLAVHDPADSPLEIWAATGGGVYYSADGGANWTAKNTGLENYDVVSVAVCNSDTNSLAIATRNSGVYTSTDKGASWTRRVIKFFSWKEETFFGAVAIDPTNPLHMFAGKNDTSEVGHVFESTDGGATWKSVSDNTSVIKMAFSNTGELFYSTVEGGMYRYNGTNTKLNLTSFGKFAYVSDFDLLGGDGSTIVLAAASFGVWLGTKQANGTYLWVNKYVIPLDKYNTKIGYVTCVASDPQNPSRVLFYLYDSYYEPIMYESLDLLTTNTPINVLPESKMFLNSMLITTSGEFIGETRAGVFKRLDSVSNFGFASNGMSAFSAAGFDYNLTGQNSSAGGHQLFVTGGGYFNPYPGNGGVYVWEPGIGWLRRSSNGLYAGVGRAMKFSPTGKIYSSIDGFTLYSSNNQGLTWTENLPPVSTSLNKIYSMEFSSDGRTALVGSENRIYKTVDEDGTWAEINIDPSNSQMDWFTACDIRYPSSFFATANDTGGGTIYHTTDGGGSWAPVDAGFFGGKAIDSFAIAKSKGGLVYAGSRIGGLFKSIDGGLTWTAMADGLNGLPVVSDPVKFIAVGRGEWDMLLAAYFEGDGIYISGDGGNSWFLQNAGIERADGQLQYVNSFGFAPDGRSLIIGMDGMGLRALPLDSPPKLREPGPIKVFPDRLFTYYPQAYTETASDTFTYALASNPVGASFDGSALSWTPTTAFKGLYTLKFEVRQNYMGGNFFKVVKDVVLDVQPHNYQPVLLPIGAKSTNVGQELAFVVSFTDQDATDTLTVTSSGAPVGAAISKIGSQWWFKWTPDQTQAGDHSVKISVTDGKETVSEQVPLHVNAPPVLARIGDANGLYNTVVGFYVDLAVTATDPDLDDTVTIEADTGGVGNFSGNRYTWTFTAPGDYPVTFTARDSHGAFDSETVIMRVLENAVPNMPMIGPKTATVGSQLSFNVTASDLEGREVAITVTGAPAGASWTTVYDAGNNVTTGTFTWTPDAWTSPVSLTFTADDGTGGVSSENITITVNNLPVITTPADPVIAVVKTGTITPVTFKVTASDSDVGDSVTLTSSGLPSTATATNTPGAIDVTWSPTQSEPQRSTLVTFEANDGKGGIVQKTLTLMLNRLPVFSNTASTYKVVVGTQLNFSVVATDADSDPVTYTVVGLPTGAQFKKTGELWNFSWLPGAPAGPIVVEFTATDSYGGATKFAVNITVSSQTPPAPPPSSSGNGGGGGGCFIQSLLD